MSEIGTKLGILRDALAGTGADGVRLRGVDWFAWITGGGDSSVLLGVEEGVAEALDVVAAGPAPLTPGGTPRAATAMIRLAAPSRSRQTVCRAAVTGSSCSRRWVVGPAVPAEVITFPSTT